MIEYMGRVEELELEVGIGVGGGGGGQGAGGQMEFYLIQILALCFSSSSNL